MAKISRKFHLILVGIFFIVLLLGYYLGYTIIGEKIKVIDYDTYTEYKKELDSNTTSENISTYIKKGFSYQENATRYIVNAIVKNKLDKTLREVWIEVEFYDENNTHIGSVYEKIPLLPKKYKHNISVEFTSEFNFFERVHHVGFETTTYYQE